MGVSIEDLILQAESRLAAKLEMMGEVGEAAIVRHENPAFPRWMMVHRSTLQDGGWRLTTFLEDGFWGHMEFASKGEAVREAARSGFYLRDDDALSRLQDTPAFVRGCYKNDLVVQMNAGEINAFDAAAKLNAFDARTGY